MSAPDQTELERVKAERDEWKKMAGELAKNLKRVTCSCEGCIERNAEPLSTLTRYNQLKGKG